ncbi:putative inorganic phosphate cotransporter [Sitophilus oryzae]|uniref:Putative inorganic phosphate cotransporter n=1 Tax=Sitophilus oryzae TaxID=7048 RepID=A0A6J2XTK0_SITOR|nr:putative inorganic phosphate cotransporter [Sitophilus oryzae]
MGLKNDNIINVERKSFENKVTGFSNKTIPNKGPKFGSRHMQCVLVMSGLTFAIAMRTNLSVAIVAMVDNSTSPNPEVPTYTWSNTSIILSSFFWSYVSLQLVAGYLGRTYGPKYFLLSAYLFNCCAHILIPLAAEHLGSTGVIVCRIFQGFGQSFLYPSTHVMLGQWAPFEERSTLGNIAFSGVGMGSIFGSTATGYIAESWLGWPYVFYIMGSLGLVWSIFWILFGYDSPAKDPRITEEERKYIQSSLKQEDELHLPVPWKKIFTCVQVYALLIWHASSIWCYGLMMTEIPTYLSKAMNYNIKSSGLVTSIPTIFSLIGGIIIGYTSDWLINNNYVKILTARRIFSVISIFGHSACLICLSFLDSSQAHWSVFILSLNGVFTSASMAGPSVAHLDLSPRFSGIIFGFLNGIGQCFSILSPLVAQWVITDPTDVSMWRILFLFSAGFLVVGGSIYLVFMTATRQEWDGPEIPQQPKNKKISVVSLTGI